MKSLLFLNEFLNIVESVEGLNGGEVVDVEVCQSVSHLSQHRVVELEESELRSLLGAVDVLNVGS